MDITYIAVAVGAVAVLICSVMIARLEKAVDATWSDDDGPTRRWNFDRQEFEFKERGHDAT